MSGKRAKPKGADPSVLDPSSAESPTADRPSVGVTTDLLERPTSGQAAPVLPGSARAGARSAARVERQRRERRRRLIAAGSVAALVLGLLGWLVLRGDDATPATVTAPSRTQSTVLLAVGGESITGLALLAADPATGEGAVVLLPNRLMVDVAGFGPMTLAQATELSSADAGADALTDALGVTIDGTWRLDDAGLAALVDAAGGVTVDVDTDITGPGPNPGSTVILIPAGSQTLDGASAVVYAAYLGAGEPEQSRLARLDAVLSAAVAGLPAGADQVTLQLGTLGAGSSSTVPELLPPFLANLNAAETATSVVHRTLPVRAIDAGAAVPATSLDVPAAASLVSDLLSASATPLRPGGSVRVLVQNGVGTPGLGASARDLLVGDGFTYVAGGNASSFGVPRSLVLITDSTAETRAEAAAVAKALGLPDTAVRLTPQGQSIADMVVVLGKDFRP